MNIRTIIKKIIPKKIFWHIEPTGHLIEAFLTTLFYGFPMRKLKVIGVTGTNGKTTTTLMIHQILNQAGYKVGFMSTIGYGYKDQFINQEQHMTTVSTREMIKRSKKMQAQGMEWLVLETTSHALAQHRVYKVPYSIAVFTNLTHEHLAYHHTFERYRQAKVRLFKLANKNKRGLQLGIANADDPNYLYFTKQTKHNITFGLHRGDLVAKDIKLSNQSVSFKTSYQNQNLKIQCHIPGSFNVENSLAAAAVGLALKISPENIEKGIDKLRFVEGRMNSLNLGQKFNVIIDYAHSPDSFEKLFKDIQPNLKGKLIVLFGSLGGGDKGKRPLQGELAGQYADFVFICEEDDRLEKPEQIMLDIAKGVEKAGKTLNKDYFMIHDRPAAILASFKQAKDGDTVLLLGKGHEKTIEDKDGEHPWNETKEAIKALEKLGYKK
jgi:UDP-N-acetylmuramoyl-L-alanyl-D-glutamate--2,6-diaminopimelate ligase